MPTEYEIQRVNSMVADLKGRADANSPRQRLKVKPRYLVGDDLEAVRAGNKLVQDARRIQGQQK